MMRKSQLTLGGKAERMASINFETILTRQRNQRASRGRKGEVCD